MTFNFLVFLFAFLQTVHDLKTIKTVIFLFFCNCPSNLNKTWVILRETKAFCSSHLWYISHHGCMQCGRRQTFTICHHLISDSYFIVERFSFFETHSLKCIPFSAFSSSNCYFKISFILYRTVIWFWFFDLHNNGAVPSKILQWIFYL